MTVLYAYGKQQARQWLFGSILGIYAATGCGYLSAQPAVPPPQSIWVSLGYSSYDNITPDWKWLKEQCAQGKVLVALEPAVKRVKGIVVPVFSDGQCFYNTSVVPFEGRNHDAVADESSLHLILDGARRRGVPIYLGVNVLGWQKSKSKQNYRGTPGIFSRFPHLQETSAARTYASPTEALYASPFNKQVRTILISLIKELGTKFPEASGLVLDLRLSDHEILGYSDSARAAAIIDLGSDPIDLNLSTASTIATNDPMRQWIRWRLNRMANLLADLKKTYRDSRKDSQVLISGRANYYAEHDYNDLRMSQDWASWLQSGLADGAFVEGRWLAAYNDGNLLHSFLAAPTNRTTNESKLPAIVPVSNGSHLTQASSFQSDWAALKARSENLEQVVLLIKNDDDLRQAIDLLAGRVTISKSVILREGEIAPEWDLPDTSGTWRNSQEFRGLRGILLFVVGDSVGLQDPALELLKSSLAGLSSGGMETLVLSSRPIGGVKTHVRNNFIDKGHAILSQFSPGLSMVVIDKAGFIRRIQPVPDTEALVGLMPQLDDPTPKLEEGKPAPDFSIVDMNGAKIKLAALRGKKNLLLTFFPKCFTGG